jgi:hypothetical protein
MTDNIIEIQYRDKLNWISIDGTITNWTNYSKKYKDERIQPYYIAPVVVPDTWNGKEHEIQHTSWTSYFFELFLKESEIHQLATLKSCSDIRIIEYSKTDAELIITKTYIPDLSSPEIFIIAEPERASQTSSWKTSITFRTNRTVINKGESVSGTNELKFSLSSEWQKVSETTSPALVNIIASMTSTRIGVINAGVLTAFDYINYEWTQVGNSLDTTYNTQEIAIVSIDIDNVVIMVDTDDYLAKYTFDGEDWTLTGNVFTFAAAKDVPAIAKLDSETVAVFDATAKLLETYTFDGTDWAKVGNSLAITIASLASISISGLNTTSIAYTDSVNSEIRIYDWNGTDWTLDFGTAVTVGNNVLLTSLSATNIVYIDVDNKTLKQYVSSGSAWSQTKDTLTLDNDNYNSLSTLDNESVIGGYEDAVAEWSLISSTIPVIGAPIDITALTSTRIAAVSWTFAPIGTLQAYDYVSGDWELVGNALTTDYSSSAGRQVITTLTSSLVAIYDYSGFLTTYTFDGTNWSKVGNSLNIGTADGYAITYIDSTHIALYRGDSANTISTYVWNGTDWAQTGSTLSLVTGSGSRPDMGTLSATSVVFVDSVTKKIRKLDWNGSAWSTAFTTSVVATNPLMVTALTSTKIAFVEASNDSRSIQAYQISGSAWVTDGNALSSGVKGMKSITSLDSNTIAVSARYTDIRSINNYDLGDTNLNSFDNFDSAIRYFSDFDVIEWNKPTESVNIEWYDKTTRLAQTINKTGLQFLLYLSPSDLEVFMSAFKGSSSATINDVTVTEMEVEPAQIADDYMKIILRGVTTSTITNFDVSPLSTYNIRIVKDAVTYNYYTDYPPQLISQAPDISRYSNETGVDTPVKNISKTVSQAKFFLNEADAFSLKKRFELFGTVTLNFGLASAALVLESVNVKPNQIGVDLYEVEVPCLTDATVKY